MAKNRNSILNRKLLLRVHRKNPGILLESISLNGNEMRSCRVFRLDHI
jgi:hypothetical protein